MSLRDELRAEASTKPQGKVEAIIQEFGEEAEELKAILADPNFTTSSIQRLLRRRGHEVSHATLCRYREGLHQ